MRLLTHSRAKSWRACNRRHYYAYELGYRTVRQAEPLFVGSVFHESCAEPYWCGRRDGLTVDASADVALEATRARLEGAVRAGTLTSFAAAKLTAMATVYVSAWNTRPDVQCLAVEQEFQAPLVFDGRESTFWRLAGKIDAIVRLENGEVAVMEHKTSSADVGLGSTYRRRLTLDEQLSIYYEAAAWQGYAVDTIVYDVIRKPRQKPYEATPEASRKYTKAGTLYANMRDRDETPDEYLARLLDDAGAHAPNSPESLVQWVSVYRSEDQRKQFASVFRDTARLMRLTIDHNIHPLNSDACFHASGAACDYIDVCEGTASLDDPALFRRARPHEELTASERTTE